jgi:hypothetical protein
MMTGSPEYLMERVRMQTGLCGGFQMEIVFTTERTVAKFFQKGKIISK